MANKREGDFILNNYDKDTGLPFNSRIISEFPDGTPITDADVDNKVLLKNASRNGGGYSVRSFDVGQTKTLVVNNIEAIRNLSKTNILMFKLGIYTNIRTEGYYEPNDGGGFEYLYNSSSIAPDDGFLKIRPALMSIGGFLPNIKGTVNAKITGIKKDVVTDNSILIQKALDTASDVSIPKGTYWISDLGLKLVSNQSLTFEEGAVLRLIPSNKVGYSLLYCLEVNNVRISGGEIIGDKDTHLGTTGEWGNGVVISDSQSITVENLKVSNCWGDGVNFQTHLARNLNYDISLINVTSDNNRRQGLTINSVTKAFISNCKFNNTKGAAPQTGIDIEPNENCIVLDVVIDSCEISGNEGNGIVLFSPFPSSVVQHVTVKDTIFINNNLFGIYSYGNPSARPLTNIFFTNILIENEGIRQSININQSENCYLTNVTVIDNGTSARAVTITSSDNVNISKLDLTQRNGPRHALCIINCRNSNINSSTIDSIGRSLFIEPRIGESISENITIENVTASSSEDRAFVLIDTEELKLVGLRVLTAGYDGINVENARGAEIRGCRVKNAGSNRQGVDRAMYLTNVTDSVIVDNRVRKGAKNIFKAGFGIDMNSTCVNNIVKDNDVVDLDWTGLRNQGSLNYITDRTIKTFGKTNERPSLTGNTIMAGFQFFDSDLGKPVYVKGDRYSFRITVTSGAVANGDLTISFNGGAAVTIPVLAGDTPAQVASKINNATYADFTKVLNGAAITFTRNMEGVVTPAVVNYGTTGITAAEAVMKPGLNKSWVDSAGAAV